MIGLFDDIVSWANDRKLIKGGTPQAQMLKLMEEVGETASAIARGNVDGVKDGIGDAFVVLTILAAQHGLTASECIECAWGEIKDRRGRMVGGIFIKDEGDRAWLKEGSFVLINERLKCRIDKIHSDGSSFDFWVKNGAWSGTYSHSPDGGAVTIHETNEIVPVTEIKGKE